jgi:hypothetical protein
MIRLFKLSANVGSSSTSSLCIPPDDKKGYLRAAKILLVMGDNKAATKIYERGVRDVPEEDANYKVVAC